MKNASSRELIYAAAVASLTIVADQLVKVTVNSDISVGERIYLAPGLELVNVRNSGIAFGLLAGKGSIVIAVGLAALIGMGIYLATMRSSVLSWVSFGLLLGGATSNIADRIVNGAVTDYIDPIFWPAFNLADVAIVAGVFGLLAEAVQPGGANRCDSG